MADILIIGGGFAGLQAARTLSKNRAKLAGRRVLLVDMKRTFDLSPVLPDVVGGRIQKDHAVVDLTDYLARLGVNFEQNEVVRIDPDTKEVFLKNGDVLDYEYLVVCCGCLTDFHGQANIQKRALKMDSAEDAAMLSNVVSTYPAKKILVVGGGSTGVAAASNLALRLKRKKIKKYSINIIEEGEDILGPLPEWMKDYCRINLAALRVNIHTGCSFKEVGDQRVRLSNGMEFEDYLLVWTAGVSTPGFVRDLKFEKDGQGRLFVDRHMKFAEDCFAAGDAAAFKYKGKALRRTVLFSLGQARVAALNIVRRSAAKKRLIRYRPFDPTLFVPMANRKACGRVFKIKVWGIAAWFFHYAMCICQNVTFKNKFGLARDAFLKLW